MQCQQPNVSIDIHSVNVLAGGAKYGDLPGILALSAPGKLWLAGEGKHAPEWVKVAYKATGQEMNLVTFDGEPDQKASAAVEWLLN